MCSRSGMLIWGLKTPAHGEHQGGGSSISVRLLPLLHCRDSVDVRAELSLSKLRYSRAGIPCAGLPSLGSLRPIRVLSAAGRELTDPDEPATPRSARAAVMAVGGPLSNPNKPSGASLMLLAWQRRGCLLPPQHLGSHVCVSHAA